jgi:hypothetical protein
MHRTAVESEYGWRVSLRFRYLLDVLNAPLPERPEHLVCEASFNVVFEGCKSLCHISREEVTISFHVRQLTPNCHTHYFPFALLVRVWQCSLQEDSIGFAVFVGGRRFPAFDHILGIPGLPSFRVPAGVPEGSPEVSVGFRKFREKTYCKKVSLCHYREYKETMEYHGYPNCILHLAAKSLTHAEVGFNDVLLSLDRGDNDIVLGSGHGGVRILVV